MKPAITLMLIVCMIITGCIFGSDDNKEPALNKSLHETEGTFEGVPITVKTKWSFSTTSKDEYWGLWAKGSYKSTLTHTGTDNKTYKVKVKKMLFYDKNEMLISTHTNILPETLVLTPNTSASIDVRFGITVDSIEQANTITSALASIQLVE